MNKVSFSEFKKVDIKNINFSNQANFTFGAAASAVGKGLTSMARGVKNAIVEPAKKLILKKELGGGFVEADKEALNKVRQIGSDIKANAKEVAKELKDTDAARAVKSVKDSIPEPIRRGAETAKDVVKSTVVEPTGNFIKGTFKDSAKSGQLTRTIGSGLAKGAMGALTVSMAPAAVDFLAEQHKDHQMNKEWGVDPNRYYAVEQDYNDPSKMRLVANKKGYDNRDNGMLDISKESGKGKNIGVVKGSSLIRTYNRKFYDNTQQA